MTMTAQNHNTGVLAQHHAALAEGQFLIQKCGDCGQHIYFPQVQSIVSAKPHIPISILKYGSYAVLRQTLFVVYVFKINNIRLYTV
jgi:hypothetical protein